MKPGSRIVEARQDRRLTQRQVADAVGVSVQAVSLWETGRSFPRGLRLKELAALLGVNPRWLAGDEGAEKPAAAAGKPNAKAGVPVFHLEDLAAHFTAGSDDPNSYAITYVEPFSEGPGEQFGVYMLVDQLSQPGSNWVEIVIFDRGIEPMIGDLVAFIRASKSKPKTQAKGTKIHITMRVQVGITNFEGEPDSDHGVQLDLWNDLEEFSSNMVVLGVAVERRLRGHGVRSGLGRAATFSSSVV